MGIDKMLRYCSLDYWIPFHPETKPPLAMFLKWHIMAWLNWLRPRLPSHLCDLAGDVLCRVWDKADIRVSRWHKADEKKTSVSSRCG